MLSPSGELANHAKHEQANNNGNKIPVVEESNNGIHILTFLNVVSAQ
jgi:hypothetical protein